MGVYYRMPIHSQIEMLFKKKTLPSQYDFSDDNEHISDFKDGSIYQDFLKKENSVLLSLKKMRLLRRTLLYFGMLTNVIL